MKTSERIMAKTDNLKTYGNIMGKAGYGLRMAAVLGYKVGYNMAKHPNLHKIKQQIQKHPRRAGMFALIGLALGVLGITGYLLKGKYY